MLWHSEVWVGCLQNIWRVIELGSFFHKNQNERLKEEQLYHIRTLLKQAKERDSELEQVSVVNKEHVEAAMKEKWKAAKEEDAQIEGEELGL